MTDPAPARRVGHQPTLLQLRGWVHYHQVYLLEAGGDLSGMLDDGLASPVGIICVRPGSAFLTTGLHTGVVGFTVAVADRDPGADLDTYEDVVEISYDSPTGIVWLEEWGGEGSHTLPPLAGGSRLVSAALPRPRHGCSPAGGHFRGADRRVHAADLA